MALLYLKQTFFPQKNISSTKYSSLPTTNASDRDSAQSSIRSSLDKFGPSIFSDTISSTTQARARIISDATIGLSDGLTVPFALTAGLSALNDTKIVIYGGLAELIAGAISMGLGGYLGAKGEAEAYQTTLSSTAALVRQAPSTATSLITSTLTPYRFPPALLQSVSQHVSSLPPDLTTDFLLHFHHQLPPPPASRPYVSALTIAAGYFFGGFLPLLPYFFVQNVHEGLAISVLVMAVALLLFGGIKARVQGEDGWRKCAWEGCQMLGMGALAAGASVAVVRGLEGGRGG